MANYLFEMLIPKRPVSHQAKNRANLQNWKDFVYGRARKEWKGGTPLQDVGLRFTLVYLCNDSPADVDNIIKPIQDALIGVVFADDSQLSDVDSHRRFLSDTIDITSLPPLLIEGVATGEECVYVRVSLAEGLEVYL
jgi:Holliday junction resolvase RusA-like endonuclease